MELRQLEYLVAVAEEASFTKAAARVFVTQPCVSAQIRRLERELGQDLLDRGGRTVQLTNVGAAALPHARAVLAAIDGMRGAVEDLSGLVRGQVSMGSVASSLSLRLHELIADFSEKHPAVEISLSEGSTDQLTEAVRAGRIDVAIIGTSAEPPAGLESVVIADESLIGAVGHNHPLAQRDSITVEEVERHALMCLSSGSAMRATADVAWAVAGIKPRIAFEAGDPQVLAQLAARGLGVAILPERFVFAQPEQLHPVEILSPHLRGGLALVWRSSGRIDPAARALVTQACTMLG
ncbi:LysR family transcriptional regulator [Streptomyces sp. SID13666]|uniref:LysR family transcriptional regulator n=1 Tax=unclassified Streptomyces TaxID=2593676 RepID=UPI0013BEC292|nr:MULTISPECIES: LysR family transcriptional regulator [unclassified Streptomyces]NEA55088.1 LysR family transcriptional regulator [Streptomyces sp. SID13666]NEA71095.1 LysR family transcriptional regulator [Streptomyces sp. SID13588]